MRRSVGAVLLVGHLTVGAAAAQTVSATMGAIDGRVTDHTNAVLPGVTITATNTATNQSRTVTTGKDGRYYIGALQPGTYILTAELAGYLDPLAPCERAAFRAAAATVAGAAGHCAAWDPRRRPDFSPAPRRAVPLHQEEGRPPS